MKYLKLKSLSWWASFAPLLAGIITATEHVHGWEDLTLTIHNMTGGMSAAVLINAGLLGIGLRGAIND